MEEALKAIVGEDLAAAEEACTFVEDLICNKKDYEAISIVRQASVAYANDATVIMRFARIFCKVCSFGDDEFSSCERAGAVGAVVSLCTTDDILMQMNAIQLLSSFGDTQRGLEYLCSQGVLAWLVSTASGEALSPATVHQLPLVANPDSIIRTESMRVLGTIFTKAADRKFDILRKMGMNIVSHFLWTVKKHFEEGSEEERLAGMGTLADFSIISIETLQLVLEGSTAVSGLQGTALLDAWMDLLANSKAEIVSALLQSVAFILSREDAKFLTGTESGERDHVVALKRQLVSRIGQARRTTTVAYRVKLATQPVEATRYAAINLMRALADQQSGWGLQLLFAHAQAATPDGNFYMYLQERLTEYCKEGKDWKFSLITSVWQCPAKSHLPADVNKRLDELVAQGAYYLPPMMDVQTAEA